MRHLISIVLFFGLLHSAWGLAETCQVPTVPELVQKELLQVYLNLQAKGQNQAQKTQVLNTAAAKFECETDALNDSSALKDNDEIRWALVAASTRIAGLLAASCNHEQLQFNSRSLGAGQEELADDTDSISLKDWEKAYCRPSAK